MIGQQKTVQTRTNAVSVKSHDSHALRTEEAVMFRVGIHGIHGVGVESNRILECYWSLAGRRMQRNNGPTIQNE
jgi:hypothetical protein